MKCYFCRREVAFRVVTHIAETPHGFVEFQDVPCEECSQCRERYFSPETIRRLQELSEQPAQEFVEVPAYKYV
jgi:YgiT-type zinc finger domain-containing protein